MELCLLRLLKLQKIFYKEVRVLKHVKQFRWYGDQHSDKNYPIGLTYGELKSGNIFKNYGGVIQLGIQAPPGTKFYLNDAKKPIIIGITGIFELNLIGLGQISLIRFDGNSLDVAQNSDGIIIDILYEGIEK